jgi:hypothetical protein
MRYDEVGYLDGDKVYQKRQPGGGIALVIVLVLVFAMGIMVAPRLPESFWAWMYSDAGQSAPILPTAAVVFSQPVQGEKQAPPAPPRTIIITDNSGAPAAEPAPLPTVERPVEEVAPAPAPVVEAPPPPPTALPEPGQPGFTESFQEPTCASGAFITYLPGHPCHGRNDQPPLPQPGDPGFAESFEEVGE